MANATIPEKPESVNEDRLPSTAGYGRSEMDPGRDAWELIKRVWLKKPTAMAAPVDPVAVARRLGVEVYADDELGPEVSGILRKKQEFTDPEIFLNDLDTRERRRFTCAHALGHYTRNVEIGRAGIWEIVEGRDFFAAELCDVEEVYATEFALEMLIPRAVLVEITDNPTVASLAATFGVTGDTMRFRLDQIGWRA